MRPRRVEQEADEEPDSTVPERKSSLRLGLGEIVLGLIFLLIAAGIILLAAWKLVDFFD